MDQAPSVLKPSPFRPSISSHQALELGVAKCIVMIEEKGVEGDASVEVKAYFQSSCHVLSRVFTDGEIGGLLRFLAEEEGVEELRVWTGGQGTMTLDATAGRHIARHVGRCLLLL